ncbi:MAG: GNAT family N-acetyltransferase [Anaerolineales bacterium]|jgi:GNAT superfamily N-acetyltransferase
MSTTTLSQETIQIPGVPTVPGLKFRHYRGESDLAAIVKLNNLTHTADQTGELETIDQLTHRFAHLKNCDPQKDVVLAELDGELIAYSRVSWVQQDDGIIAYRHFGNIHPEWRRKGLGSALLPYNERRLRKIAQASGHNGDTPQFFESFGGNTTPGNNALLENAGYEIERYFYEMIRPIDKPIPDAPLPEGLEIRPFEDAHNRPIWEAIDEAFRDHWGYVAGTEEDYLRFLNSPTRKTKLWKVAWDGDQVAGMVLNNHFEHEDKAFNRKRGWTDPICVRRPWRRRGLAKALIAESIRMFCNMGFDDTALGVDTNNPNGALKLYESMGYQLDKTWMSFRKPMN